MRRSTIIWVIAALVFALFVLGLWAGLQSHSESHNLTGDELDSIASNTKLDQLFEVLDLEYAFVSNSWSGNRAYQEITIIGRMIDAVSSDALIHEVRESQVDIDIQYYLGHDYPIGETLSSQLSDKSSPEFIRLVEMFVSDLDIYFSRSRFSAQIYYRESDNRMILQLQSEYGGGLTR